MKGRIYELTRPYPIVYIYSIYKSLNEDEFF